MGRTAYVGKPIDLDELVAAIGRVQDASPMGGLDLQT
jgi:hypothetical protein